MKTLIAIPKYDSSGLYIMPQGILYVSAATKRAGHDIVTLNLNHFADRIHQVLEDIIAGENIDSVATGGLSGEFPAIFSLLQTVKNISPQIITICGGGLVTASPEIAMQALEFADIGIVGEGDSTFPNMLSCLEDRRNLNGVPGIIFRKGNRWVRTSPAPEIDDLDSLPLPDYSGFEYSRYLAENCIGFDFCGNPLSPVSVIGTRSCPYSCTFCFHPTGSRYRTRSLDAVFHEINFLTRHYRINCIALREELFSADKERIFEFCRRIRKYSVLWTIQLRVNTIGEDIIRCLAEAKCFAVFVWIESISDAVLKSMNKKFHHHKSNRSWNGQKNTICRSVPA